MPSLSELKEFLTAMGVPLPPDFVLEAGDIVEADACQQWLKGKCVSLPDEPVKVLEVATPRAKRQTQKSPRD